ncbi:hypothetical protein EOK75_17135 (plasmid) [Pseudorhodobacter turbinis]|uniref:DUF2163 domain-containing protein n=1 Tax=Pseudorhodobacter turbinis TaxID=2500533 RepID=A0A4P8EK98_9RHOB|nr:hypothetical protein [Pseudorhodobacter turbinis]QCO57438.1 hypothetical protein EOK75_17135 [Pseudorhodobacter turbinis]
MKTNSTELLATLTQDNVGFFFIVHFQFNANYYFTTLPYDLNWNGNLYRSEDTIIEFEAPRATTVVDRQTYRLRLSGLDPVMSAEIENGIIHLPVTIQMGFTINEVPLTGIADMNHVYSGTVSNAKKEITDSSQIFSIECSAPLSSLDAKSTLFTTRDGIRSFSAIDTCFDQVLEGGGSFDVNWGKS